MKVLVWDLENSPINADIWTLRDLHVGLNQINMAPRVMCWAAKWVGSNQTMFRSEHHHSTQDMLETFWNLWDEADVFVHFNGTAHDLPHMRREFLLAGMPPPKPITEVDLLKVVRREFKFPSNRLAYVSDVLGLGGKADTGGHGLWTACMAGDDKAWAKMRRYCKRDVEVTEQLYLKVKPWARTVPNVGLVMDGDVCPGCGSQDLVKRGFHLTAVGKYQRFRCGGCGRWPHSGKALARTDLR